MGLEDVKLSPRVLSLKNELLSVEFPQCLNKLTKILVLFDISFKLSLLSLLVHCVFIHLFIYFLQYLSRI